jgi:fluoride exporter
MLNSLVSKLNNILVIGCGGALGAFARYGCNILTATYLGNVFPYGTLLVNALGSGIMGVVATVFSYKYGATSPIALFLMVGFLGAFTTFSSFSLDTLNLFLSEQAGLAIINIVLNFALCLLFVTLGMLITKSFF